MCSTARTSRETAATLGFALADHFPLHGDRCGGFRHFPGAPLYDGPAPGFPASVHDPSTSRSKQCTIDVHRPSTVALPEHWLRTGIACQLRGEIWL